MALRDYLNTSGLARFWDDIKPKIDAKFGKVKVGATNLTPTSSDDSFTLAAGSNVTLTPDGTTNTITISANGGGSSDVHNLADAYDATATYNIGDYCIYSDDLYFCTTKITIAEAWNSSHWTKVTVTDTFRRVVELTQAQYNQLSTDQQNDNTIYCITDASSGGGTSLGFYLDENGGLCEVNER